MHLTALPDSTRRVLRRAREVKELRDHLLIGGTALTLHIGHRRSEDLDFVQPGARLNREVITLILDGIRGPEKPRLITSRVARQHFENDGADIDDVHQDWLVDETKVTFFCPERAEELDVLAEARPTMLGAVAVVDPATIFKLKAMVVAERWTSRDAFDLCHFVERGGRTIAKIDALIFAKRPLYPVESRLALLTRPFPIADPGFDAIDPSAPADKDQLLERMRMLVEQHRRSMLAEIGRLSKGPERQVPTSPISRGR